MVGVLASLCLACGCSGDPNPTTIDSGNQDGAPTGDGPATVDGSATDGPSGIDASTSAVDCETIWQWPGHGTSFYEDNPTS